MLIVRFERRNHEACVRHDERTMNGQALLYAIRHSAQGQGMTEAQVLDALRAGRVFSTGKFRFRGELIGG